MKLKVLYESYLVGILHQDTGGRINFDYSTEWKNSHESFPVSHSLPLSGNFEKGIIDHQFFANLLPEAAARETICRGLGISRDNDFELLAAIGGECAGALQIMPEETDQPHDCDYEPISDTDLKKALETRIPYTRLSPGGKLRLSLAGAQDKWPVYVEDGKLYWPIGSAPSSHILKFTNRDFKGLHWNEAYTSFLARKTSLPVVDVTIGDGYSLTRRYDRLPDNTGTISRLHQEDFCQALGYPYYKKYESDGGPVFSDCINLVRNISVSPAKDQLNLLQWQILNILLGNADGHAKNLSILYSKTGPVLSPFYDFVCTAVYPGISRDLALSVGGNADPGQIRIQDWNKLADELGIRPRVILNSFDTLSQLLQDSLTAYYNEFVEMNGSHPVLEWINQVINKRIRRVRTLLKE